jgi:hypothetical protein
MGDPLLQVRREKIALQQAEFEWKKQQAQQEHADRERARGRAVDLEYLKITVLVLLLIIVIWYLTCKFGFLRGVGGPDAANANQADPPKKEHFSPYASILTPDIQRTDSSFDYANNMPYKDLDYSQRMNVEFNSNAQRMASEDRLADQLLDLVL